MNLYSALTNESLKIYLSCYETSEKAYEAYGKIFYQVKRDHGEKIAIKIIREKISPQWVENKQVYILDF